MANLSEEQIKEAFDLFATKPDTGGEKLLDPRALGWALRGLGFGKLAPKDLDSQLVGKPGLTFAAFTALVQKRMAKKESVEEWEMAFRLFDADKAGRITAANLRLVAESLQEKPSVEELAEMLAWMDKDKDGVVTMQEWNSVMASMRGK
eukprot:TRINITY_DN2682_c0_g1_i1.p2 TRINITY_DN2682_c0_g1~~TRINITY_DN2682_c0_g1_i1.p2  ORF type:complete len:159 (-),score=37.18 TRINITY_DN2682_c0_g1_i1:106-552(-)